MCTLGVCICMYMYIHMEKLWWARQASDPRTASWSLLALSSSNLSGTPPGFIYTCKVNQNDYGSVILMDNSTKNKFPMNKWKDSI